MKENNNYFYGKYTCNRWNRDDWKTTGKDFVRKRSQSHSGFSDKNNLQSNSIKFINADLRDFNQCLKITKKIWTLFFNLQE